MIVKIQRYRRGWIGAFPLLGMLLILLLSACSGTAIGATTTQGTPSSPGATRGPTNHPPATQNGGQALSLLLKVVQAAQQVKTVHIDVTSKGTVLSSGGTLPTPQPQTSSYTLKLSSNVSVASRQEQGLIHFTQSVQGQKKINEKITEIVSGNKLYYRTSTPVQNAQGGAASQWMVLDLAQLASQQQIAANTMQAQELLTLAMQNVTVTEHGVVMLKGVRAHHLTAMLPQSTLAQIAANTAQPMLKQILTSSQLQAPLQVDLYVNEATSLPLRIVIKGQAQINVDMLMGQGSIKQSDGAALPHTLQVNAVTRITFSKYNSPVTITTPNVAATGTQS